MKRVKDEEKTMGPMFPRLHVNDTEKGGPRAPPRNKMALYEQLSIPSQRFNGGVVPLNPNSTVNSVPPSSSSHGGVSERGSFFPLQQPPSVHPADKTNDRYSDLNNQPVQEEQKKKHDEEDFRVPIFVQQSGISPNRTGNHQNKDNEGRSPFNSAFSGHLANIQKASEIKNSQESAKSASNQLSRKSTKIPLNETNRSSSFGHGNASNDSSKLQSNRNLRDYVVNSQAVNTNMVPNEAIRVRGYVNSSLPVRDTQQEVVRSPNDPNNGDAVSETSMVDSISGVDISPDDVVGIIGQKHFWKARRAIVNQQRVFAVQVFELHRLIKVQRLIAGSPQLLVEDDAYSGKPLKVSPIKKIPLEYVLKSTPNVPKLKDDREKPNDNMEFSAENAVGKASLFRENGGQTTSCGPFSGYKLLPPDPKMGSSSFNQPPGHQWLIPVMTPSEGLVYKPYPGPGFMSPFCGGCGPPGSAPPIGRNFVNYGVPPHHHYFAPPASHGYFPPYCVPTTNPNPSISGSGTEEINLLYQQAVPNVVKVHACKNREVQVSTASSPSERTRGQNALPLFPISPPAEGGERPPRDSEPARVIRVVPHNARSATESVARIFQSIQEERKQCDSV